MLNSPFEENSFYNGRIFYVSTTRRLRRSAVKNVNYQKCVNKNMNYKKSFERMMK